jgi:threonine/homoserine/homoserine lactone efflux protein
MADLLGQLLAVGLGAAISPVATALCIALLGSGKPLENALAFTLGYAAVLAAIALVAFTFFGSGGGGSVEHSSAVRDTIDAAIGVLLLVFALKAYLKSPDPNAPPPKWVAALDSVTPTKALLVGTIVILTNPTTLALYVSGLKEIVAANLGGVGSVVVLALFIALVEVEFLAPTALYVAVPRRRAKALLGAAQRWLVGHNRGVMIAVFSIFGVLLVAKGASGVL